MNLYALLLCGIIDNGDILSFVGSLCQMFPNLTTRAYRFSFFYRFFIELAGVL